MARLAEPPFGDSAHSDESRFLEDEQRVINMMSYDDVG